MIPSQMLRGILQGSILALLAQGPSYGYALTQDLARYGFGQVSEGTIYPLLLRLENGGSIFAAYQQSGGGGPRRKYYALTDRGREELDAFRASFWEMTGAVSRLPGLAPQPHPKKEERHGPAR